MSSAGQFDYKRLIHILLLAAVYYATSKFGFSLAYVAEQVTVIWPPTGIALAAVLLIGPRLWPGIMLGAFLTNITAHEPVLTAMGIACGNTLEALVGGFLLQRYAGPGPYLRHIRSVLGLIFFSATISTMVSATIGAIGLCLGGVQAWAHFDQIWFTWWLGDAGGALIAAPFLLAWFQRPRKILPLQDFPEAVALILGLTVLIFLIFINPSLLGNIKPYPYMVFPMVFWTAIRFSERGVTAVTLLISAVAIWATSHQLGPFMDMPAGQGLSVLQIFTIITGSTGLLMSAAINERNEAGAGDRFLASVVESTEECIIGKTLDGTISAWNKGAENLFGYTAAEAIGRNIGLIVPPEKKEEEQQIIARLRQGQKSKNIETIRVRKDGRRVNVLLNISPIFDSEGNVVGASKIGHDITARVTAEKKLQAAHQFQQDMINHIPDPIFMKDRQHRWIGGNRSFWEFMGGTPEKFLGKSDYEFFPKEEADVFWEKDNKVFNSGEVDVNEEFFTDTKGVRHVLSTKKVAFRNEDGDPFLIGVIRDVTESKQKEAQLLKYMQELQRSNQELDDFAYIASHDLKEPLRGMQTQAAILLEDYQDKILDAEGARRVRRLTHLSQRMEKLISDLLYFSRLGRTELAIQETDPNELIAEIRQMMEMFLKERQARIVVPHPLPRVTCDKLRVTEVFRNLITNAVKYNNKPERLVEVGYLETAKAPHGDEKGVFYVRDNGIGIGPEYHDTIFRIFKRLENFAVTNEEGTGSGLTFVKKIVERHKGRIWLESEIGKGSTFYFTLGGKEA